MRRIDYIAVHTEGAPQGRHGTVRSIRDYHKGQLGWDDIGYHYVVEEDGQIKPGRAEVIAGAHIYGLNAQSLGVCVTGNADISPFNPAQYRGLVRLLAVLQTQHPEAYIIGHREVNQLVDSGAVPTHIDNKPVRTTKSCPGTHTNMKKIREDVRERIVELKMPIKLLDSTTYVPPGMELPKEIREARLHNVEINPSRQDTLRHELRRRIEEAAKDAAPGLFRRLVGKLLGR